MELNGSYLSLNFSQVPDEVSTESNQSWKIHYRLFASIFMILMQIMLQLSVGCSITWRDLMDHVNRSLPISVGMICQFILLPLTAFIIVLITDISNVYAVAFIVIASVPGGPISNSLTYFLNGDVSLSISMTFLSTVTSNFMIPTNLWLYGRQFESKTFVIPFKNIAFSLLLIIIPLTVGMLIKWKYPELSRRVIKIGGLVGLVMIAGYMITESALSSHIYSSLPVGVIMIAIAIPILVQFLAYCVALLFKLSKSMCISISIECCSQNIPLSIAIFSLSFPVDILMKVLGIMFIYSYSIFAAIFVMAACEKLQVISKRYPADAKETEIEYGDSEESNEKFLYNQQP